MFHDTTTSSAIDPGRLWHARVAWLASQTWTHALTLSYNSWPIRPDRIRRDLKSMHAIVDRRLFGSHFHRRAAADRTRFAAFMEGLDYHPHVHMGWHVPLGRRWCDFVRLITVDEVWSRLAPAGSFSLTLIEPGRGWWSYATKHTTADADWISSDDFLPWRVGDNA